MYTITLRGAGQRQEALRAAGGAWSAAPRFPRTLTTRVCVYIYIYMERERERERD